MKKINQAIFWYGFTLIMLGGYVNLLILEWGLKGRPSGVSIISVMALMIFSGLSRSRLTKAIKQNTLSDETSAVLEPETTKDVCPPHSWTTQKESNRMFCKLCGQLAGDE